jgi:hypothetical protein
MLRLVGFSRALLLTLVLCGWLVRTTLCYTYELRAHVTLTTDTNDYNPEVLVGYFASYSSVTVDRTRGRLVLADDTYGCPGSNTTLPKVGTSNSFIVVIPVSGCNDYLQAKKAEQDSAAGVVLYYTLSDTSTDFASSDEGRLNIPVAITEVGDDILSHLTGRELPQYTGVAIEGKHYAVFQQSRTFYFIVTAFCILILLSCLWFFTSYFRRCRYSMRNRRRQVRDCSMAWYNMHMSVKGKLRMYLVDPRYYVQCTIYPCMYMYLSAMLCSCMYSEVCRLS